MKPVLCLSVAGLAAACALTTFAQSGSEVPPAPFALDDPARIQAGAARFGSSCAAYCHGSGGEGGRAPSFKGRTDFQPAAAYQVIAEGRRGAGIMPPWGKAYTPEEIWELVAYLQHLAQQPPTR